MFDMVLNALLGNVWRFTKLIVKWVKIYKTSSHIKMYFKNEIFDKHYRSKLFKETTNNHKLLIISKPLFYYWKMGMEADDVLTLFIKKTRLSTFYIWKGFSYWLSTQTFTEVITFNRKTSKTITATMI